MSGPILLVSFLFLLAGGITYSVVRGSQTKRIVVSVLTGLSFVFFLAMILFAGCAVLYTSGGL